MKKAELQKCLLCNKGVMHTGVPLFYRIKIERMVVDLGAIQRQHGLEMMIGSPVLASVMGPDEDIANSIDKPAEALVCEKCAMERINLAELNEIISGR